MVSDEKQKPRLLRNAQPLGSLTCLPRSYLISPTISSGRPSGDPVDVLTGFVDTRGGAMGRPVGVAVDGRGALLVADDVGNTVWRVTSAYSAPTRWGAA